MMMMMMMMPVIPDYKSLENKKNYFFSLVFLAHCSVPDTSVTLFSEQMNESVIEGETADKDLWGLH